MQTRAWVDTVQMQNVRLIECSLFRRWQIADHSDLAERKRNWRAWHRTRLLTFTIFTAFCTVRRQNELHCRELGAKAQIAEQHSALDSEYVCVRSCCVIRTLSQRSRNGVCFTKSTAKKSSKFGHARLQLVRSLLAQLTVRVAQTAPKLTMLYLANEIIQQSRKRRFAILTTLSDILCSSRFTDEFAKVLTGVISEVEC